MNTTQFGLVNLHMPIHYYNDSIWIWFVVKTPVSSSSHLAKATDKDKIVDKSLYQSAVGSLLYLSTRTRPDIAFAVSQVAKFNSCPTKEHWTAVKRIMRYVKGTTNLGLLYEKDTPTLLLWVIQMLIGAVILMIMFQFGGTAVTWKSKKQNCVALSTAEAEYMALSSASQDGVWLKQLIDELTQSIVEPIVLFEDNQSAICIAKNPTFHSRTKHIGIKYHYIREQIINQNVELKYCPTENMAADVLTKDLLK